MNPDHIERSASDQIGVLLVEDEALLRTDMVETLRAAGMRVYEADAATQGLDLTGWL